MNWKTLPSHLKIISASGVVIDSVGDGFHCLVHERLRFAGALTRPPQETLPVLHASLMATPVASTPGEEPWVYRFHGSLVYQFPLQDKDGSDRGHQLFLDLVSLLDQRCGCEIVDDEEQGYALVSEMEGVLSPQLSSKDPVECPEGVTCRPHPLWELIQHLNDYHKWTRERIADWLVESENDLEFPIPEGV